MAKLPTSLNLSGPDSLRSGRVIASHDTSAVGRGLASLGGSLSVIAQERKNQENALDVTRAEAEKDKGFLGIQNEFESDPEYSTYEKRAPGRTTDVLNKAANLIRDPKKRELWLARAESDRARVNDGIFDKGVQKQRAAEIIAFDDALEVNRRIYVDPNTSDEAKAKAKGDISASISMAQEVGLLDPVTAEARRKAFIEEATFSRAKLAVEQNPDIIPARGQSAVDTVVSNIIRVESGGKENAKNPNSSASGVGQFIDSTWLATVKKHRPDITNGKSNAEILALKSNAVLGREMTERYVQDNAQMLSAAGQDVTPGNLYLAHFLGPGGAKSALSRGDGESLEGFLPPGVTSANPFLRGHTVGWLKNWADKKMGAAPGWYKELSPEQQATLNRQAEAGRNKLSVESRAQIDVAAQNAPAAIQNTGQYSGTLPDVQQFYDAYGPREGADRFNNFQASIQTSEQAYAMRTMSAADIQSMVKDAAPKSSGDDAALETSRYNTLAAAAQSTLAARESDPAGYASRTFPNVGQAWANVTDGPSYQSAIAASVAAQQQMGMKDIKPLPREQAASAVDGFKDEDKPGAERISAVSNILMATPDPEQRRALFEQMVDAGLPDVTEGAFEAMSRGDEGAARRLFQAAMVDPSKLPGKSPEKPADINETIQSKIMADGAIGDIYYGLSDGVAENFTRATRDTKLMNNAVLLRTRNGESLNDAVDGVAKDLFGDVQVVNSSGEISAQLLLPKGQDSKKTLQGLGQMEPLIRDAIKLAVTPQAVAEGSEKAILDAVSENYIDSVLAEGFFRNSGNGFVFIDPFIGAAVSDEAGQPIVFGMEQVQSAIPVKEPMADTPLTDDSFDAFQKKFSQ